ncbi:MAG: hypothetical protein M0P71_07615 [Melioribacteraceae bacterium]|jgi:hypothetical protein|nr:hypothetical protein [Melioribacteraceae bacterium]MDD3982773.1 hypothetical protein [Candidatus Omnitrophota bacterium]
MSKPMLTNFFEGIKPRPYPDIDIGDTQCGSYGNEKQGYVIHHWVVISLKPFKIIVFNPRSMYGIISPSTRKEFLSYGRDCGTTDQKVIDKIKIEKDYSISR